MRGFMLTTPYLTLRRISSATAELITLAEAKLYLRVDTTEDDLLISEIIVAVRTHAEHILARSLVQQSWRVEYLTCLSTDVTLPMHPVQSITSVQTIGESGVVVTIPATSYRLLSPSLLRTDNTISGYIIAVTYMAGDVNATSRDLRQAMLMHAAMCYDMRGTEAPMPASTAQIYESHRGIRI
jgi:uncharacterized phiE125 gp8 family phage protein